MGVEGTDLPTQTQLRLLWGPHDPGELGDPRTPVLIQHLMEHDTQGGAAVEFLHGGPEDHAEVRLCPLFPCISDVLPPTPFCVCVLGPGSGSPCALVGARSWYAFPVYSLLLNFWKVLFICPQYALSPWHCASTRRHLIHSPLLTSRYLNRSSTSSVTSPTAAGAHGDHRGDGRVQHASGATGVAHGWVGGHLPSHVRTLSFLFLNLNLNFFFAQLDCGASAAFWRDYSWE
jgi:hypothetical protein